MSNYKYKIAAPLWNQFASAVNCSDDNNIRNETLNNQTCYIYPSSNNLLETLDTIIASDDMFDYDVTVMKVAYEYFNKVDGKDFYGNKCSFELFETYMTLPDEYTNSHKWNRIKLTITERLQAIVGNIECLGLELSNNLDVKEELYKRLVVCYCLDELITSKEYQDEDMESLPFENGTIDFNTIIKAARGVRELYEKVLNCELLIMIWQNGVDDEMRRPHTYPEQEIKKVQGVGDIINFLTLSSTVKAMGVNM